MDKSVQKFLAYLDILEREVKDEALRLTVTRSNNLERLYQLDLMDREITNFRRYFTKKLNYKDKHGEIFADYKILSNYLDNSNLSAKDKYNIILFFIKKNVKSGILDDAPLLVDLKDLEGKGIDKATREFIKNLILTERLQEFMGSKFEELNEFEQRAFLIVEKHKVDLEPYQSVIGSMNDHYLTKLETYDESDMEEMFDTLRKMDVSEDCIVAFMSIVKRDLDKRKIKEIKTSFVPEIKRVEVVSNLITDKEYKLIRKEINKVYDVYNRELLQEVDYDEMIRIARLMKRIDYSKRDIESFIRICLGRRDEYACSAWEELFLHYDKYSYYIDEEIMREVESYLAEMMIADDEDYRFWKNEIIRLINPRRIEFNHKYDYELSLVYKGSK